jgi:N-methylhydantoinase A
MTPTHPLRLAIDIGGTFTDTVLMDGAATVIATAKTATTPADPSEGALAGARIALDTRVRLVRHRGLHPRHDAGHQRADRAAGREVATITTHGFRDILEIGYERRYDQYAIDLQKPDLIVPRDRAFTIGGRIDATGAGADSLSTTRSARPRRAAAGGGDRSRRHLPSARLRQPRP